MSLTSFLRAALCSTVCLAVLACSTDDEGSGGLLDADDPTGSGSSLVLTIEGPNGASSGQVTVEAGDIAGLDRDLPGRSTVGTFDRQNQT